jgi:hypothetical protein
VRANCWATFAKRLMVYKPQPLSPDSMISKNRKPIVPGFVKNAKGLVLFKKPVVQSQPEAEGIMITNDGSNHEKVQAAKKAQQSSRPIQPSITQTKGNVSICVHHLYAVAQSLTVISIV